ncbi:hypothetical protein L6452_03404 [Arctium lappa]|uniref:Uncharacterized protein n=1 Tax=Arctium lappa TaxID=4217 RepID=A0ACB9FLJ2_ARCLA|nr:hypothetical protein L6452_03404 [Arctium lappa]
MSSRMVALRLGSKLLPMFTRAATMHSHATSFAGGTEALIFIQQRAFPKSRVLKKGGRFLCLELSHVEAPVFKQLYDSYSFSVIPVLGKLVAGDRDSYQYLVET